MSRDQDDLAIVAIRRATKGRHAALEAVLQLDSAMTRSRYIDALLGFDIFLAAWEPRIDAALPSTLRSWFASRSRRALLRRDLDHLTCGQAVNKRAQQVCEEAVDGIDLANTASTFGSMYVLEGSALGGQVIAKAASVTLGLEAGHGAAYFKGLSAGTAAPWAAFRVLLEQQIGIRVDARRQACDSARQTFEALITTFNELFRDRIAA